MHTIPVLDSIEKRTAYHDHLQSDHDYKMWCDVLTMEEVSTGQVDILDGQTNIDRSNDGPTRTGSLTLSDPEGALSFGTNFARDDDNVLWVNRLVRIKHEVIVPTLGAVQATVGVGVPTAVSHKGGEVGIEWGDKSLLADHGVRPQNYKRGQNLRDVLIHLLSNLTGERNFRIPTTRKTLSRPYAVGMGENSLTPWQVFKTIAKQEGGWSAFYSCDGFATCVPPSASQMVEVHDLLALPDSTTSFTDFINYVKVTSTRQSVDKKGTKDKKDDVAITTRFSSVALLPAANDLSGEGLSRNGVPRTLPLVVTDDNLKNAAAVTLRAKTELLQGSGVESEQSYEVMPFFHLDINDRLNLPLGIGAVPFDKVSIPHGTSGNMTIGRIRWVSRPVLVSRVRSSKTVKRKRKKGGQGSG